MKKHFFKMIEKYYLLIIILIVFIISIVNKKWGESFTNNISFVNLVLYSNDKEYDKMYELTSKYYSKFSNVKTIYYKFDENIVNDYELRKNILHIKGKETYIPGILDKTIKAFQYIIDNHSHFDYVIRSNISTIVDFHLLTTYLQETPIQFGGGLKNGIRGDKNHPDLENLIFASGTSIILSNATLKDLLNKKHHIRNDLIDDVSIGVLMRDHLQNIEQHYIPENRFIFISDENGESSKILDIIKDKSYIFYRNRQPNRKTDIKQMEIIIEYLQ